MGVIDKTGKYKNITSQSKGVWEKKQRTVVVEIPKNCCLKVIIVQITKSFWRVILYFPQSE